MILMIEFSEIKKIKGLKLCHLNVRSLTNKIDQFRMHFENSELDVITLSETWLTQDIGDNILELRNYQLFRWDRSYGNLGNGEHIKKGGGLLTYVRRDLKLTPIYHVDSCISSNDCELQRIELQSTVCKNIILYNVYRPPTGKIEAGLEALNSVVENEVNLTRKEILFMGDFNIDYSQKQAANTKKLVAFQNRLGLTQIVKKATRYSSHSKTMIDLILTNMENCDSAGVIELHISDHLPIFVIKKKQRDPRHKISFTGRTYINYSKPLLSDTLTKAIKENFRKAEDPNECWDLMETFLICFLDKYCPVKTFKVKDKTPPWITNEVIVLSQDRDRAWAIAKSTGLAVDWENARGLRNWTNNSVKVAKAEYIRAELEANVSDPKRFWYNIKNVLPDQSGGNINIVNNITGCTLPKDQ